MAAAKGNEYAANARRWRSAIDKALSNRCKSDGQKALVAIAEAMLKKAEEGDMTAIKEVGDRLDGRAPQSVDIGGQKDNPLLIGEIARKILEPETDDTDS